MIHRRKQLRGWARLCVWLLHLSLLFAPLYASGLFHAVEDVVDVLVGEEVHHGKRPCSHEENGERCPPGCPDCHCHVATPTLLAPLYFVVIQRVAITIDVAHAYDATAPPRPMLSGIERPPRMHAVC